MKTTNVVPRMTHRVHPFNIYSDGTFFNSKYVFSFLLYPYPHCATNCCGPIPFPHSPVCAATSCYFDSVEAVVTDMMFLWKRERRIKYANRFETKNTYCDFLPDQNETLDEKLQPNFLNEKLDVIKLMKIVIK